MDDTDLAQTSRSSVDTLVNVCEEMQKSMDFWTGTLKSTGGALNNKKSFWYGIDFKGRGTKWSYKLEQILDTISFIDKDDVRQMLKKHKFNIATETLGVYISPDGLNQNAVEVIRTKAETFKDNIHTGHLSRYDAWKAMNTTIINSLL